MNRIPFIRVCLSLLSAVAVLAVDLNHSRAQTDEEPKIVDARIGFGGTYKLGSWSPLEVKLVGGSQPFTGQLLVTVPDSDGVPTTVPSPADRPVGLTPGQTTVVRMHVRIGQASSSLVVRFVAEGKVRCQRTFYAGPEERPGIVRGGIAATNRLILEYGPSLGLNEVLKNNQATDELLASRVARVESAAELPSEWYAYEGVDTVILTCSQPELYRPLLQSGGRMEALRKWVELGGRLAIFCGASGEELLSPGGALADLIPGTFAEVTRLRQSQPLELFAGSEELITNDRRLDLLVPRLEDVDGQILASVGRDKTELPLVVRSRLGFGELVFVGIDFDQAPLLDWRGRNAFFKRVFQWEEDQSPQDTGSQRFNASSTDDMVGTLRTALDSKFSGVQVVSFALVALLVIGYILLIGPGDYYFVKKVLGQPKYTWVTFPVLVVGVSAAAYFYANWTKGDQLRLNQVEIVDVDERSELVRGTVWTHFFTPQVDQYNLNFEPAFLETRDQQVEGRQLSWLGLPGYALGGMQTSGHQTSFFDTGYSYPASLDSIEAMPVQVWSTKTITARWNAQIESPVTSNLRRTVDELVLGHIENNTGIVLEDCLLLYQNWAYHIGRAADGSTILIDYDLQPRTVRTMLTSATAGDVTETNTAEDGTVSFRLAQSDVTRLVKAMMFFEAINGRSYTGATNRYQHFVDMSGILEQGDSAILFARRAVAGSQWLDDGEPLQSDDDRHWVYYRFVLPVKPAPAETADDTEAT